MKLFKRNARDTGVLNPADTSSPTTRRSAGLKMLMPGLIPGLLGLAGAGALLWMALQANQQQHAAELARAWGQSQASAVNQALRQLAEDTRTVASDPQLLDALRSEQPEQIRAAERELGYRDGVVDAHLSLHGQARQNADRPGPLNFAALDLLQRAENGNPPPPEAFKIGNRWLLYSAVALRPAPDQPVQGTLLLVTSLERFLATLPQLPSEAGQLRLMQQFSNAPVQVLAQRGGTGLDGAAITLPSGNPNWKISFLPASGLGAASLSPLLMLAAALTALCGLMLGLQLVLSAQQRRLREDVSRLSQVMQELSNGKTIKTPTLSLPALDALAKSLVRLPLRTAGTAPARASAAPQPAARQAPSTEYVDPLFQDTDILDIDILDEDQDWLGLDTKERETAMSAPKAPQLPASIFRAYDIRGVVGDTLTNETAYWVGRAVGSESLAQGEPNVSVGRDGRLSGPELVQHLIQGLVDSGCSVSDVGMVPTPVLYYAANVLAGKSGVMLTGSAHLDITRKLLLQAKVPVVETWDVPTEPIDQSVGFSNAEAAAAMVRYLLGCGYRRIGFIGGASPLDHRGLQRREGYLKALNELNIEPRIVEYGESPITMNHGGEAIRRLLERWHDTDAVMCVSDLSAFGAIMHCHRYGLKVPGDIAVAGFGDFEVSRHCTPTITTVSVEPYRIGWRAGEMLLASAAAQREGTAKPREVSIIDYRIIPRESTTQRR
ncbi:MAG TPA: hypothetical protein DHV63_13495 [Pseudomonas sp.]|nr:hypothetical protein [Pseudomonas sp.]